LLNSDSLSVPTPPLRQRLAIAGAGALIAAAYVIARAIDWPAITSDLDPQLCSAAVWWSGGNPYAVTGPGLQCDWGFPQFYPATAFVVLLPFLVLPTLAARAVFAAIGTFGLTMALTRDGWFRLPLLLSAGFQAALVRAQWDPLLVAALAYPALGGFLAVKPHSGAVVGAGFQRWRHVAIAMAGGIAILVVSLAREPRWPLTWLHVLRQGMHTVTLVPLGIIAATALPRWREPNARVTAAFGFVPFTHLPYTSVLLFLTPRTWRQACALAMAANVAVVVSLVGGPYATFAQQTQFYTRWGAPLVLAVAVWCVWSRQSPEAEAPKTLVLSVAIVSAFLCWLSFAVSG
jgi:hypothetical protein